MSRNIPLSARATKTRRTHVNLVTLFAFLIALAALAQAGRAQDIFGTADENTGVWTGYVLTWTAPGDNGDDGTASVYDIRCSESYISESNWNSAIPCAGPPRPYLSGTPQRYYASGLETGRRYYFAMKVADEADNWSAISNIATVVAEDHVYTCGDLNADRRINLADISLLISFVYLSGPGPEPIEGANVNGDLDGRVNLADVSYLISYIYLDGPAPLCAR